MPSRVFLAVAIAALVSSSGTSATAPQQATGATRPADAVAQYGAFLRKLPAAKKESILVARQELLTYLDSPGRCGANPSCAEAAFAAFRSFYTRVIRTCDRSFFTNRSAQDVLMRAAGNRLERPLAGIERDRAAALRHASPQTRAILSDLFVYRDCGIDFSQGEGDWYLRNDPGWLSDLARHLPQGHYREYVLFVANEDRERLVEDAGFTVPHDALRQRLVRWDTFIRTHPDVARTEGMRRDADRLAGWYIVGISNTPAFDLQTGRLDPDLRESFARFMAANQHCSYYPLIAGLWKQLKATDFQLTESVITYLEKQTAGNAELRLWVSILRKR